jgi:hypothetical protein
VVRVLDLEFVAKAVDGSIGRVEFGDVRHADDIDVGLRQAAYSGLLDQPDLDDVATTICADEPGSLAANLVYENVGAACGCRLFQGCT